MLNNKISEVQISASAGSAGVIQGKNQVFFIHYFSKIKEKLASKKHTGQCFSFSWKDTCKISAHLNKEKIAGLKKSLRLLMR